VTPAGEAPFPNENSQMLEVQILKVLRQAAQEVAGSLKGLADWGPTGAKRGEYRCDLVADAVSVEVLMSAGLSVLSEESGLHNCDDGGGGDLIGANLLAVLDPVDGSTNASQGIPWWATSICVLDSSGPLVALVVNQATGKYYEAIRGHGSQVDGRPLTPSRKERLQDSIIGISGYPQRYLGWNQYRALGAAALDLCSVAEGVLDAYADCTGGALAPWDYLGGMLICREAGAFVGEVMDRELVVAEHGTRRAPVAGATEALMEELKSALR